MEIKVNIFVGKIHAPAIGDWVKLPMEKNDLERVIKELKLGEEFIISDFETELPIRITEYSNPFQLNDFLHFLKEQEQNGELKLFLTAYWFRDFNLEDAITLLEKGNYRYYEEVHDTESLGEAVVRSGAFGSALMDFDNKETNQMKKLRNDNIVDLHSVAQYLDFEKIGNDYECSGCMINTNLKTAIMQTNPMA